MGRDAWGKSEGVRFSGGSIGSEVLRGFKLWSIFIDIRRIGIL
jgi:hypothetical protein